MRFSAWEKDAREIVGEIDNMTVIGHIMDTLDQRKKFDALRAQSETTVLALRQSMDQLRARFAEFVDKGASQRDSPDVPQ
jgi:hypothetical protein